MSRADLPTERANPASARLDELTPREALAVFQAEDEHALAAVDAAADRLAEAIELVADRLRRGGRLFYVGAGTSGRLGVLDAAECPPTFATDPALVQGVIAGGPAALTEAVEGAEDSAEDGAAALAERGVGPLDAVLGIAAGGTTPFVHGALAEARARGAATLFLACVPASAVPAEVDVDLRVLTGPEVLAGSTRLKAGTATKLVLNRLSTLVMARLGRIHGNLMIDVNARGNAKLAARARALVAHLTGVDERCAAELLEGADGSVKVAVAAHRLGLGPAAAAERLERAGGSLRRALDDPG